MATMNSSGKGGHGGGKQAAGPRKTIIKVMGHGKARQHGGSEAGSGRVGEETLSLRVPPLSRLSDGGHHPQAQGQVSDLIHRTKPR